MGVSRPEEIAAKWAEAQTHPVPPRIISPAPCQELVYEGRALSEAGGLGMLPVPISTPGFDCAPFFSSGHWVTKDPENGELNFGTYRGQVKSPTRVGLFAFAYQDISRHWNKARALGRPLASAFFAHHVPPYRCAGYGYGLPQNICGSFHAGKPALGGVSAKRNADFSAAPLLLQPAATSAGISRGRRDCGRPCGACAM